MKNKKRWWQRKQSPSRFYSPIETNHRGGEVDDRTFGNIWTRIWRNRDADGRVYYSFTQHRLYEKYVQVKLARSFFSEDPDDVCSARRWLSSNLLQSCSASEGGGLRRVTPLGRARQISAIVSIA